MVAPVPHRPPSSPRSQPRRSWLANGLMYLGLAAALAVVLGSMLVLPLLGLIGIVIIVGSILFGIVAALQYAIWARWLSRVIERERQNEQPPS